MTEPRHPSYRPVRRARTAAGPRARAGAGHAVRQVLARRRRARQRPRGARLRSASGCWPRSSCRSGTSGSGTFVVLLAAGGVVLGFSVNRRSPFTLACAALCVLLAATVVVRDAEWIVVLCLLAGAAVCMAGARERPHPAGLRAGRRRLAARRAARAARGWVARCAPSPGWARSAAALRTDRAGRCSAVVVFGLLFASADAIFAEWAGAVVPDLSLDTFVLRAFVTVAVGGVVLAATYLALNPPDVEPRSGPARPVAHRYEWLAPVLLVDARLPGVPRRAGHRSSSAGTTTSSAPPASPTPSTSTRASASSPSPPRSPCSSCGRPRARRRARRPRTWPGCAGRSACSAC